MEEWQGPSKFFFYNSFSAAPQGPKETPNRRAGPVCGDTEGGDGSGHSPWWPSHPELRKRLAENLRHSRPLAGGGAGCSPLAGVSPLPTQGKGRGLPERPPTTGRTCLHSDSVCFGLK